EGEIPRPTAAPLVVEDRRPNSGFLQIQNPSPREGFFEATVQLGDRVERGEALGAVVDLLGEAVTPILADRSGRVLVLRTFARVSEGDSVAVVLETDRPPPARSTSPGGVS